MADEPTNESTQDETNPPEGWQEAVWKAHCKGNRCISELCRVSKAMGGPDRWHTIRHFVDKRKRDLAAALQPEDERADYEAGLESDLQDADAVYNRATAEGNVNGQVGAIRIKLEARQLLAASRGVVTKREGRELSGTVRTATAAVAEVLSDADAALLACRIEEIMSTKCDPDASGPRENPD